jgi:hypothetical protein
LKAKIFRSPNVKEAQSLPKIQNGPSNDPGDFTEWVKKQRKIRAVLIYGTKDMRERLSEDHIEHEFLDPEAEVD